MSNHQTSGTENNQSTQTSNANEEPLTPDVAKVLDIFEHKWNRQVILYGPPGTSKTHSARRIAEEFLNSKTNNGKFDDEHYRIIQFHPSYNYDDFVRGIKMSIGKHGTPEYQVVNKVFGEFARMANDDLTHNYVLIIDEINRAPLASVLGELIYGLEYRGQAIDTPYSCKDDSAKDDSAKGDSKIVIPRNLYIIGTMNTADRSIGSMDYAVRRRFAFVPLYPDWNVVEKSWEKVEDSDLRKSTLNVIAKVWQQIGNALPDNCKKYTKENAIIRFAQDGFIEDDVHIGHTYFIYNAEKIGEPTPDNITAYLKYRMDYEIKPILMEYLNDGLLASSVTKESIDNLAFDPVPKMATEIKLQR